MPRLDNNIGLPLPWPRQSSRAGVQCAPGAGPLSLAALHAALRKITETLANELGRPGAVVPDWSETEWAIARAVAAIHGVSPLLSLRLRWRGPPGWQEFLALQHAHTLNRHRRIEDLLRLIDRRARDDGIEIVALKGAALHAVALYRAGERPMADLDLLVSPGSLARTTALLESLGYRESYSTWKHRVFVPEIHQSQGELGEHAENYITIEVHERIGEQLLLRPRVVTHVVLPARRHPGVNSYPSLAALMIHLLLHAAGAMTFRALRLLQLSDLALLSARMTDADWRELLGYCADDGSRWWAWPPLQLTARYYPDSVPVAVLGALAADCPWLLTRAVRRWALSDVSFSYLWIRAFPGMVWSQSASETLSYAASRVWPGRDVSAMRKLALDNHVVASHSQWDRLSQGRRVLRWLSTRQARPDTLFAVRAALAQRP